MKKILSWLVSLFGGKKPPVIVVPKPPEDKPVPKPFKWEWKDRRPIGMIALTSYREPNSDGNRQWKLGGEYQFSRDALMAHAKESIQNILSLNGQGMVTWDIEGQRYPQPWSFIGDPTLISKLAPEMDELADEYFKMFRDAGLLVGLSLRPTKVVLTSNWMYHESVADPYLNLLNKVVYARERWGCRLFYIDSNVWTGKAGIDCTQGGGYLMEASYFEKLAIAFPDCLFMPEHQDVNYHRFSAPYNDKYYRWDVEPAYKAIVPEAFQVLSVSPAFTQEELNASVKEGNILMFEAWWKHDELARVKGAYSQKIQ